MSKLKEKLESLVDGIKDTALDLTTIEVSTLTGNIQRIIDSDGKFDTKSVLKSIHSADGQTKGDIRLAAHTFISLDQDQVNFIMEGLSKDDPRYILHMEAVESAKKSRQAFLDFIGNFLKSF